MATASTLPPPDKVRGVWFGLAYGDALAAPIEFETSLSAIARYLSPTTDLPGTPARVTDDTQMALAVGDALQVAQADYRPQTLEPLLRAAFVAWLHHPDNNRAPGLTCLSACRRLAQGVRWQAATVLNSKGCGANMRVAPVGLLPTDDLTRAAVAQFQAALTHGHPTALAASDLTAYTVADLARGGSLPDLPRRLRTYAAAQRTVYHASYLGDLWRACDAPSPEAYITRGWDECLALLDRLDTALAAPTIDADPCLATGDGWIAEEAFATALLCFLRFPSDPVAALRRATLTRGDSDSIACLAGAFAGASHGFAAWPTAWHTRIEYRDRLEAACRN